jgi:malate synthase
MHASDVRLDDGRAIDRALYERIASEETEAIRAALGAARFGEGRFELARAVLDELVEAPEFIEFLTLTAYRHLP